jgi:DNA-binding NarL/FixJ family response regulator
MANVKRILIVEPDRRAAAELFGTFEFGPDHYYVDVAESVAEAVEKLRTLDFHCLIVDARLPEMDASQATTVLKELSKGTPVIVTAETNTLALERRVRQQQVDYYHIRSGDRSELREAVRSLLDEPRRIRWQEKTASSGPTRLQQLSRFVAAKRELSSLTARQRLPEAPKHTADTDTSRRRAAVAGQVSTAPAPAVWAGGQRICTKCFFRTERLPGRTGKPAVCPKCGAKMVAALFVI